MTLIELMIAVAILGVIIFPLFGVMYVGLTTNQSTIQRTSDSGGAQLLTSYFVTDVQSADQVTTTLANFKCGGANTKLELEWTDADPSSATDTVITYDVVPPPPGSLDTSFRRTTFSYTSPTCTQVNTQRLMPALDTTSLPVITCAPTPSCPTTTQRVSLHVAALSKEPNKNGFYDTYTLDLTGTRRVTQ